MDNSEKFVLLHKELEPYRQILEKAYVRILEQGATKFPIFVLHQEEMSVGIPIVLRETNGGLWNIYASSLEEFATKQLIRPERLEEFQGLYTRKGNELCLFVLSELGASFVFLPRLS